MNSQTPETDEAKIHGQIPFGWWVVKAEFAEKLEKERNNFRHALSILFSNYKQLADSGDAGHWRLEDTDAGKIAMAALGIKDDGVRTEPIVRFWETTFEMNPNGCGCQKCNPRAGWMVVCSKCGNKRCPKAEDHEFQCTNLNESNQIGVKEASQC